MVRFLFEAVEMLHDTRGGAFQDRVIAACQHVFPDTWNSFEVWHRSAGTHEGALNVPYETKGLAERFRLIGELAPTQNPIFPYLVAGATTPIRLSDVSSLREVRRTEFYDVVFKPVDIRHQVAIPVQTESHVGGITFNKGGQKDFTDDDMEWIRMLARQIEIAHRTATILSAAREERAVAESLDHLALRRRGLSRRECEVLTWIPLGKTDKEIAVILGNSHRTISQHVRSILKKLGVENRTAAAALMRE